MMSGGVPDENSVIIKRSTDPEALRRINAQKRAKKRKKWLT